APRDHPPALGPSARDRGLAARRLPRAWRGRPGHRGGGPHLMRVDRRLPAGRAVATARRADHRGGCRLSPRADRGGRPTARRLGPCLPDRPGADRAPVPELTISEVVTRALAEDVGDRDVTTAAAGPEGARARAGI